MHTYEKILIGISTGSSILILYTSMLPSCLPTIKFLIPLPAISPLKIQDIILVNFLSLISHRSNDLWLKFFKVFMLKINNIKTYTFPSLIFLFFHQLFQKAHNFCRHFRICAIRLESFQFLWSS